MNVEQQTEAPTHFRWTVFVLACGTSWMLYLHRYIFGLIKPTLEKEYGLGETDLGLLDSGFAFFYSTCQIPMGIAIDAMGVHMMLTGMIVVWCIGLALHAWAPQKEHLWYGRALLGIGQSGVFAAISRITRRWFPSSVRTTIQGWAGVFFGRIGGVSANLLVGSLMIGVLLIPWRNAVYMCAGSGLILAVLFALLYRNSPREHPSVNEAEADLIEGTTVEQTAKSKSPTFREMFARMSPRSIINLLTLNVSATLSTIADNIFSAWIPLFLAKVHGLEFKEMGIYSALPLLGGAMGGAVGGWLNDFLIRTTGNRRWARTAVGLSGKGIAAILLATSMLFYDQPRAFCCMLFLVKFFSDWSLTTTWGTVTDIGGRSTATVFAFNNAVASMGAIVAPAMYGAIAEHASWEAVFYTGAATYALCALTWLGIDCRIPIINESDESAASPNQ